MNNIKEEYQKKFQEALEKLNQEQRQAVDTVEGPVVVIAGPGTGKTQILTLRIANIVNQQGAIFAKNILALTFTNAGVRAVRERLADFVGIELAHEVGIFTFHSFAESLIKRYPEYFGKFFQFQAISEPEQYLIIEEILTKGNYKKINNFSNSLEFYLSGVLSAILDLKDDGISPKEFEKSLADVRLKYIDSKGEDAFYKRKYREFQAGDLKPAVEKKAEEELEKQKELLDVYQKYQERLEKEKKYDFSDMILAVLRELENNRDFLAELQEEYLYILVDEHQDTNHAQNHLIELIGESEINEKGNFNIFTVGDAKQAIYRFQGANEEAFKKFAEKYPQVKKIILKNNYRSSQNILDTAHEVLAEEKLEARHPEFAKLEKKVSLGEFQNQNQELIYLAEDIQKKIEEGVKPSEIAVFYRKNREMEDVRNILEKDKIPVSVKAKENILDNLEIQKFILLLESVEKPYNDEILGELLFAKFLNLNPFDVVKVLNKLALHGRGALKNKSILKIISSREILEKIEVGEVQKFLDFGDFLKEQKTKEKNQNFLEFFEEILNESDFLKYILKFENSAVALARLETLFSEAKKNFESKKNYSLKDFLDYLGVLKKFNLKLDIISNDLSDGIQLMTAHGSKGLEFEYVYILNFVKNFWDKSQGAPGVKFLLPTSKIKQDDEDARKLFYVALTRGKKEVQILYSKISLTGKEQEVSRFLAEISEERLEKISYDEKTLTERVEKIFTPREKSGQNIFDKEYIQKLFLSKPLAVTALNNYFKNPILYFFRNLIQLPSAKSSSMEFGSLIHDVLEEFYKEGWRLGKNPGLEKILEILEAKIENYKILEDDFEKVKKHAEETLTKYYQRYQNDFNFNFENVEKSYSRGFELENGHILRLYGKIDKVERNQEGELVVVDYKTGYRDKAKRKKSEEELKRQLVFYKFLLDENPVVKGEVVKGILDFVEAMKGKDEIEAWMEFLNKNDVKGLKKEINAFANDILSGEFLEREYDLNKMNDFDKKEVKKYLELLESLRKSHQSSS